MTMGKYDIPALLGILGAIASMLFGPLDGIIVTLAVFTIVDYITGVASGIYNHELSSKRGFKGIVKKICIWSLICVIHIGESRLLDGSTVLRNSACMFYIGNEGVSILENIHECGVTYPAKIEKIFESWKDDNNE